MQRSPERVKDTLFDVVVIGGGINGAGIARDAALRGLRVALLEKGDFASGTSSRSSKLLHGGLRYLEQFQIGLVREALRERGILLNTAPLVTQPLRFLVPVYRGDPRGVLKIRSGLWLYDRLAGPARIERPGFLASRSVADVQPSLEKVQLKGAGFYTDASMNDARLCFLNVLDAYRSGAVCVNYMQVTRFVMENSRIAGVAAVDLLSGNEYTVHGRTVVNATGPWADSMCRLDPAEADPNRLRTTKGVHIVVPLCLSHDALLLSARSDRRVFFVIPWGDVSIIGTTDTDYEGDPDAVEPEDSDIDYLLTEAQRALPRARLTRSCILYSYAGLRPLVRFERGPAWQASREHKIVEHHSGMLSVLGGKYTTYRAVAEQVVDLLIKRIEPTTVKACETATRRFPGMDIDDFDSYLDDRTRFWRDRIPDNERCVARLVQHYGTESDKILELVQQDHRLLQPIAGGASQILAEIVYTYLHEMAVTLDDTLRRRLGVRLLGITEEQVQRRLDSATEL